MSAENVKVYKNCDVLKVVGFIPPGHKHLRLAIVFSDQTIVLHEATVAAIVRAYIDVVTHPTRRAVEYVQKRFCGEQKHGYAEYQLVESGRSEDEIIDEWCKKLLLCEERKD